MCAGVTLTLTPFPHAPGQQVTFYVFTEKPRGFVTWLEVV